MYASPSPRGLPNPGIKPSLPHCRRILYQLSHQGSPRILEWVAAPFSTGSSQPRDGTHVFTLQADSLPAEPPFKGLLLLLLLSCFSRVRLCATPQTAAHQAPPSLGFSRQEH